MLLLLVDDDEVNSQEVGKGASGRITAPMGTLVACANAALDGM